MRGEPGPSCRKDGFWVYFSPFESADFRREMVIRDIMVTYRILGLDGAESYQ